MRKKNTETNQIISADNDCSPKECDKNFHWADKNTPSPAQNVDFTFQHQKRNEQK